MFTIYVFLGAVFMIGLFLVAPVEPMKGAPAVVRVLGAVVMSMSSSAAAWASTLYHPMTESLFLNCK